MSNPASSSKNILSKSGTDTGTLSFTNFTTDVGEGKIEFKHDPTGINRQIKLKVDNNAVTISNKGAVSALSFHGDGSALTGISTNSVYSGNSNLTVISSGGDEYITLGTNNNERIRLTKDGKLGIGINNPSQLLDVDGVVKAKSFDGNSITIGFDSNYVKIANSIYNVNGITLTLPVNTGTSGQYLETDGSGNMSWSTISIPDNDKIIKGESNVSVINNGSEQFISFTTNSSEKVRIISNGNVGIGLTNPAEKLDVNGTVKANKFMGDGSNLTNIVIGDASNSLHEQKKVSFIGSGDIQIKNIESSSNVIKINNDIEVLGNTSGTEEDSHHGTSVIRIFHGNNFTKKGRLISYSIKINDYKYDFYTSNSKYFLPLILERVSDNYTMPRYTIRGIGGRYTIYRTGVIQDIPFNLQFGSDEIKENYTIGFTTRNLVKNSDNNGYVINLASHNDSGICHKEVTQDANGGNQRWIYTAQYENEVLDLFNTNNGIGQTISLPNDRGDLQRIEDTSLTATTTAVSYFMSAKVLESNLNEITRVGDNLLSSPIFNPTEGGLYIMGKKTSLVKGKLKTWNGYISSPNKYITPVILTKFREGIYSQYRIKGIGTSYTKSSTGLTGDIPFNLQVGYDTVDIGDTFGFLDRRIVWDNASSQFTTNTPYSGSIGYNEIAVNIGDNEWANVTNSIGKYINNNVILDTTFGDIDFDIDTTYNNRIEYNSLQRGHIIRLQGSGSSYDSFAIGTEKITKTSNIIGIKFRFYQNPSGQISGSSTIVGLSPSSFTYHNGAVYSNEVAISIHAGGGGTSTSRITYNDSFGVKGSGYKHIMPSGFNPLYSTDVFQLKLNEHRTKIEVIKNEVKYYDYPDGKTIEELFGSDWDFIPDLFSFVDRHVEDLEYIYDINFEGQNHIHYPLTKQPDPNFSINKKDTGYVIQHTKTGSLDWDNTLLTYDYISPDTLINGIRFKSLNITHYGVILTEYDTDRKDTAFGYTNHGIYRFHATNSTYGTTYQLYDNRYPAAGSSQHAEGGNSHTTDKLCEMRVIKVGTNQHKVYYYINGVEKLVSNTTIEADTGKTNWKLRVRFFPYDNDAGVKEFGWTYKNGQDYVANNIFNPFRYDMNFNVECDEKVSVGDYIKINNTSASSLDNKFHEITNITTAVNSVTSNTQLDTIKIKTNANSSVSTGNLHPNYGNVNVNNFGNQEIVLDMLDKSLSSGDHHLFVSWMSEYQNSSPNDQILSVYYKTSAYTSSTSLDDGILHKKIYQTSSNTSNNTTTQPVFFRVPAGQTYYVRLTRSSESSYEWLHPGQDLTAVNKIKNEDISIDYVTPGVSGSRYNTIYKNNTRIELQDDSEDKLIKFTVDNSEKARIITNGNVGIGLTNPTEKLEVNGSVKATSFQGDGSGITNISVSSGNNIAQGDSKVEVLDSGSNGQIKFTTDNTEKMKIENDKISIFNNVELLSSGDVALKIKADTDNVDENDNALLVLSQDNDTVKMEMGGVGSLGEIYTDSLANAQYIMAYTTSSITDIKPSLQFVTKFEDNPLKSRMTILNDGKIGIGTNSPGTIFEIIDSEPYITLRNSEIENTDGGCESKIIFEDHGGNCLAQIQGSHDGTADDTKGNLIFSTSNGIVVNEVMNINNNGNIRIGKTTNDSANVSGRLAIVSNNSTTTDLEFRTDDTTLNSQDYPTAKIESGFTSTSWNTSYLKFRTHASNAVGFTDDMIIRGGNVGIGTNDPKSLLEIKGSSPKLILRDNASNTPSIDFIRGTGSTTFGADAAQDWKIKSESGNLIFFTQSTSTGAAGGTSGQDILKMSYDGLNYIHKHFEITQTELGEWQNAHTYKNQGLYFDYGGNKWNISYVSPDDLGFSYNGRHMAWLNGIPVNTAAPNVITALNNFTGQHRSFINEYSLTELENLNGLIVSANKNSYTRMSNGLVTGNNAITINESLPDISITIKDLDKSVFGVISNIEDVDNRKERYGRFVSIMEKEVGDTRPYINSVGEGAIWVSDKNGNLESGDYITSCTIPGYGMKQNDDILHNYTVAKITMDCNFNPVTQSVRQILKDSDGNNILDSNGFVQWENHATETEKAYKIRYLLANGTQITEADYTTRKSNGENVYKAAFVGCTYHCG